REARPSRSERMAERDHEQIREVLVRPVEVVDVRVRRPVVEEEEEVRDLETRVPEADAAADREAGAVRVGEERRDVRVGLRRLVVESARADVEAPRRLEIEAAAETPHVLPVVR